MVKPIRQPKDYPIRKVGDFDISYHHGQMWLYKRNQGEKPQLIVLTPEEQEKVRRALT